MISSGFCAPVRTAAFIVLGIPLDIVAGLLVVDEFGASGAPYSVDVSYAGVVVVVPFRGDKCSAEAERCFTKFLDVMGSACRFFLTFPNLKHSDSSRNGNNDSTKGRGAATRGNQQEPTTTLYPYLCATSQWCPINCRSPSSHGPCCAMRDRTWSTDVKSGSKK